MLKTSSPKVPDAHRNIEHLGSSCTAHRAPWRVEDATDGEWQWSLVDGFNPGNVTWNLQNMTQNHRKNHGTSSRFPSFLQNFSKSNNPPLNHRKSHSLPLKTIEHPLSHPVTFSNGLGWLTVGAKVICCAGVVSAPSWCGAW